jgi:hypothetical protein
MAFPGPRAFSNLGMPTVSGQSSATYRYNIKQKIYENVIYYRHRHHNRSHCY